ncbi:MAG TPA: tyrosine--tRNA ligase [Candidatus Azoamicus sp. OHIO1]
MNYIDIFNAIKSGSSEIVIESELLALLRDKRDLRIKVGFDPTSDVLHLGHFLILRKLRQFQDFGYKVDFLIGDFTARIGDPTGKSKMRKHLTKDEVLCNYKTYSDQAFKILNSKLTNVLFNSSWFNLFKSENFIKISSMVTVSKMLERSDFKFRYASNVPIGMHEFLYPLLQAYDSVFLKSDIEVGGIDQKFNFLLSRELQKKFNQKSQVVVMMPLLKGLDGVSKMSKSLGNYIGISDKPYDMFCKIMSISDDLMREYYLLFGFSEMPFCTDLMELKINLAINIILFFYNNIDAAFAKQKFLSQFCKSEVPNSINIVSLFISDFGISLLDILSRTNLVNSSSESRRMIKQRAVSLNGCVVEDRNFLIKVGDDCILQIGKKKFVKVILKKV